MRVSNASDRQVNQPCIGHVVGWYSGAPAGAFLCGAARRPSSYPPRCAQSHTGFPTLYTASPTTPGPASSFRATNPPETRTGELAGLSVTSSNKSSLTIFASDPLDASESVLPPCALVREVGVRCPCFTLIALHSLVASRRVYPYGCMWQVTFRVLDFLETEAALPWHLAVPGQHSFHVELAAAILAGSDWQSRLAGCLVAGPRRCLLLCFLRRRTHAWTHGQRHATVRQSTRHARRGVPPAGRLFRRDGRAGRPSPQGSSRHRAHAGGQRTANPPSGPARRTGSTGGRCTPTPNPTTHTPHPTPHTPHPTPHTPYPIPHTLKPEPFTLNPRPQHQPPNSAP